MPIYEYQCQACGHQLEHFQKVSDKALKKCPECGKQRLQKLVSSTSFQLKGQGWYVTDFRDKKQSGAGTETTTTKEADTKATESSATTSSDTDKQTAKKAEAKQQDTAKTTTKNIESK